MVVGDVLGLDGSEAIPPWSRMRSSAGEWPELQIRAFLG
jgi:hypothetical protein